MQKTHDRLRIQFKKEYRHKTGGGEGWPAGHISDDIRGAKKMSAWKRVEYAELLKGGRRVALFKNGKQVSGMSLIPKKQKRKSSSRRALSGNPFWMGGGSFR